MVKTLKKNLLQNQGADCLKSEGAYKMVVSRPSLTISNDFLSETTWPTWGKVGKKVYIFSLVCMTEMATMSMHSKTLKNLLLKNHFAHCLTLDK